MAIKHKAELGLDPASAEIIVLRRLIYGDYTIDEVEELSLTVRHALKLFSVYLRSGVDYYLRLSPESGAITASRTEDEFCGPIIAKLSLSVRGCQLTPVLKYRAWKVTLQFLPRSLRGAQSGFAFSPVMGSQLPRRRKNLPFLVFLALVRLRRRTSPDG